MPSTEGGVPVSAQQEQDEELSNWVRRNSPSTPAAQPDLMSLAPKSVTAPVAMGIAAQVGGVPALAAVFAALTGMVGALSARWLFGLMRLPTDAQGMALRGFALGTASHGIGAAHALQVHAEAGAYAGLALGLQVVLAAVLMPLVFRLL